MPNKEWTVITKDIDGLRDTYYLDSEEEVNKIVHICQTTNVKERTIIIKRRGHKPRVIHIH